MFEEERLGWDCRVPGLGVVRCFWPGRCELDLFCGNESEGDDFCLSECFKSHLSWTGEFYLTSLKVKECDLMAV